ncbi:O-antigen polymerase [Terrisporobacter mayombei]|uniref:O-antigen polymerase n=1 Tax=Terrisporobacter mayombei TaxID=1541 RepID=UPI0026586553|nr:O-antigen polymerase [Terrisporobacter mayombei]MCC3670625.1 oligosaccharide repeat unit polymerase [Terrisporobacter mayombei]
MIVFTSVLSGLIFAFITYIIIFYRIYKNKTFELLDWFLLSLGTLNGIGFGFVMWATYEGRNPMISSHYLFKYDFISIVNFISLNIILLISILFGWFLKDSIKKNKHKGMKVKKENSKNNHYSIEDIRRKFSIVAWVMIILSIVLYYIYSIAYGGFSGILYYKKAIRAGISNINNPFSFLKKFGAFSFFSSFIFYGILLEMKTSKIKSNKYMLGLVISVIFSIYVLYTWEGRVGLVVYLVTFILAYILFNYKTISQLLVKLMIATIIGLILIVISDMILGSSEYKLGIIELLSKELTFPFISYIVQFENNTFRWFTDILLMPLYILPQSIWGNIFGVETASSFNTFVLMGARKGQLGVTGEMPIDLLTISLIQAPIIGVVVMGIIFGWILHFIEKNIKKIPIKGVRISIYSNIILFVAVLSVLYGDPEHIVTRNFYTISGFILLWILSKIKFKPIVISRFKFK